MRQNRSFRVAGRIALAASIITTLGALLVAAVGVAGLAGWSDYSYRISLLPGTHLLEVRYQPSWEVRDLTEVCPRVLSLLVLAFMLSQLWLLLRAVAQDAPFTDQVVRRLRVIGLTLIGWELLEPFLWLFLSPKAREYGLISVGPRADLELGSMEPGGPQLTRMAFGVLLLLLAQVFRRGVRLEQDQRLTV